MEITLKDSEKYWGNLSIQERRNKILELGEVCKDMPQVQLELNQYFCNGVYAREMFIPKGVTLVGEIHLFDQINVVSKGKIKVVTDQGEKVIEAPAMFISPAGVKRAGFALEDTIWIEFHSTTLTNEADIRKERIAPDYETLEKVLESKT